MLNDALTRAWTSPEVRHSYTTRDTILYALGVGIGADPLDAAQLRFTYEKDLVVLPTMASVLASPGFWMRERAELGIDHTKLVHGEQGVTLHAALPPSGTVIGRTRVLGITDKGVGKGAILRVEKSLTDEASGALLATVDSLYFLRGDGGFSNGTGGDPAGPALPALPETAPRVTLDLPIRPDAALLYRLSGDINPLHADPAVAAKAGFPRPILHGLATFGICGHGLVKACCDYEPSRLRSMKARFSAPVYPGETLRLEAWPLADGEVAFRARALERDLVVLNQGRAQV